ncbi:MAG: DMT family transporter [Puniceicoccales bacterium]|jgi:S-adenosylmethionine uptake transporter|nr:DMT family transporter [Puniceicoccales bacterium]
MFDQVRKRYLTGIAWFIASLVICETNDAITKFLGKGLSPLHVIFGRFFFSTLTLFPFMLGRAENFRSRYWGANCLRGLILFVGMFIWCYGLDASQLSIACLINFTTPMFTLILAAFILKEKIGRPRIIATIIGFLGVAVVLNPRTASFPIAAAALFLISAVFFAALDVLNKILVTRENTLTSLFYTGFFTMLFSAAAVVIVHCKGREGAPLIFWEFISGLLSVELAHILLLILLGIGANLLMFCILKSFSHVDISATAPFRYIELILASAFEYLFFGEKISINAVWGAIIIVPSVIYLARYEAKARLRHRQKEPISSLRCC